MIIFSNAYPGRIQTATSEYPRGTFKDKSAAGANDGTPIADAERLRDWHGAFYGILGKAGRSPSGTADTATDSDVAKAIFEDGAITSAAISEITLSKLSSGNTNVSDSYFKIYSSGLADEYTRQDQSQFFVQNGNAGLNEQRSAQRTGWGDTYVRGTAVRGDADSSVINDGAMSIDISAYSWSTTTDFYTATVNRSTGLKWETGLLTTFSPHLCFVVGSTSTPTLHSMAVQQLNMSNSGGILRVDSIYLGNKGFNPNVFTSCKLFMRFTESPL